MPLHHDLSAKHRKDLDQLRLQIVAITRTYGVRNVRLFGSFARGDYRKSSDVDLLIDLPKGMSLLDLAGLKVELEDALHRKVDIVAADTIKPTLRQRILSEARPL